jgi:hypothetical protein
MKRLVLSLSPTLPLLFPRDNHYGSFLVIILKIHSLYSVVPGQALVLTVIVNTESSML